MRLEVRERKALCIFRVDEMNIWLIVRAASSIIIEVEGVLSEELREVDGANPRTRWLTCADDCAIGVSSTRGF